MTEEYVVVCITAGNQTLARRLARALVERRAAACVNTVPQIESCYRWQGRMETDAEALLLVKTRRDLVPEVRRIVSELHTANVPEVIALPIIDGSPAYLDWIGEATR